MDRISTSTSSGLSGAARPILYQVRLTISGRIGFELLGLGQFPIRGHNLQCGTPSTYKCKLETHTLRLGFYSQEKTSVSHRQRDIPARERRMANKRKAPFGIPGMNDKCEDPQIQVFYSHEKISVNHRQERHPRESVGFRTSGTPPRSRCCKQS